MKKYILIASLTLAGCGGLQKGAEEAVRANLRDPESARFGNFYFNEKTKKGCLTVNAKNSMGGYTGDQQAHVQKTDEGWESIAITEVDLATCQQSFADTNN